MSYGLPPSWFHGIYIPVDLWASLEILADQYLPTWVEPFHHCRKGAYCHRLPLRPSRFENLELGRKTRETGIYEGGKLFWPGRSIGT